MCLMLFAYRAHPDYRLILAANRDEFYARLTAPLDFWPDHPRVLAGRDIEQKGTWLGVTRGGRIAAITNYRDPRSMKTNAPSRGHLVADFLFGKASAKHYLEGIRQGAERYNGFNLIIGDNSGLYYFSNHASDFSEIEPGIHGLSNHQLDTPWPKVELGKKRLQAIVKNGTAPITEALFDLLQDQTVAADDLLPQTGVDLEWERVLSPMFISSPGYGTRSSSVILIDQTSRIRFSERTWMPGQTPPRETTTRRFDLVPEAE